ncbi:MAG: diaminopimelate epimerase [Gammaproteobacteria bacterium]|nr:diaminopimelate epimerase [Gammaproteobacteria bacterium]
MSNLIICQSLGNSFILIDSLDEPYPSVASINWSAQVKKLCAQHSVDGVLVIEPKIDADCEVLMFNIDGSYGNKCLNGVRSVAYYLVKHKNYSANLKIAMNGQLMECKVTDKIVINVGKVKYQGTCEVVAADKKLFGHIADVGNPHFVVLQQVTQDWLATNGATIEQYPEFPDRTNVEFVWQLKPYNYQMLVYERGCGITKACGSGAAAVLQVLYQIGKIAKHERLFLTMLGGILESYIDSEENIIQELGAIDHAGNTTTSICITH